MEMSTRPSVNVKRDSGADRMSTFKLLRPACTQEAPLVAGYVVWRLVGEEHARIRSREFSLFGKFFRHF